RPHHSAKRHPKDRAERQAQFHRCRANATPRSVGVDEAMRETPTPPSPLAGEGGGEGDAGDLSKVTSRDLGVGGEPLSLSLPRKGEGTPPPPGSSSQRVHGAHEVGGALSPKARAAMCH